MKRGEVWWVNFEPAVEGRANAPRMAKWAIRARIRTKGIDEKQRSFCARILQTENNSSF
jgi:hypothetical protein